MIRNTNGFVKNVPNNIQNYLMMYKYKLILNKFNTMVDAGYLEEVYRNEGTSIYKVLTTESEPLAVSN